MLIPEAIHIWRTADGDYHAEWQVSRPDTRVNIEPLSDSVGVQAHRVSLEATCARVTGLPTSSRHSFRLCDQHGTEAIVMERKLGMQGTPNFRDFGGYRTHTGRQVRWGHLFRSGQLGSLSSQDVGLLASLELDFICDFRQLEEQQSDPSKLPTHRAPKILSLPIIPGSNTEFFEQAQWPAGGPGAMFDLMIDINRDFVEVQKDAYAGMFREILEVSDARFLVHCTAGKDRTGFAAAIILLALGVPEKQVMADYILTARFFSPSNEVDRLRHKYQFDMP
ncbi:MAG: tyrosine-protein phosphatase, partial [Halieaceae bacterium]|nr:tyrosine-protein phosphatase [Halieaceae bacterium]